MKATNVSEAEAVRAQVRAGYAEIARVGNFTTGEDQLSGASGSGGCCGSAMSADQLAERIGYATTELRGLPEGANLGLSCGNPTALAALRPGEVVLDLGSGGGFDVFLAGPRVGATGRVIGVDMTPEMLTRARGNLAAYQRRTGLDNAEFRLGEIEHLPVADASVDVVISNCVLNLSPDKPQVWREIARVLKPGGRVAVSDLALLQPLPEEVRGMVAALVGCVAGAPLLSDTQAWAQAAGLVEVELEEKGDYVAVQTGSSDPLYERIRTALPDGATPADFVTSVNITARKPG
ncbi:MAG: arsenite methyltransferase [Phycisphaerales bacterium]|nr:arsenite methyltransferase [Phycisphaerales bacterium]